MMKMCFMQLLLLCFFILAMLPHSSASFCVCKAGLQTTQYQTAIDYACGQGVDCTPIRPNGQCYNANGIQGHCSFAANTYYQKNSAKGATCDFQGVAVLTNSDPSGGGCSFSAASGSGSTSTGTTTPVSTVPTSSPTTPTGGGGGIMPITPVSGTGTSTPGTSTGSPTSGTSTGTGTGTSTGTPTSGTGTGTGTGTGMGTGINPITTPNMSNPTSTGSLGGGMGMAPTATSMDNHGTRLRTVYWWSAFGALAISAVSCM